MQNFASQCLDQTKALLKLNFHSLSADGTVMPVDGEVSRADEPGHAALAFGEYFRATGELHLDRQNIAEIVARTITAQVRISKGSDNGMAFACLGLLAFGPTRERNPVWELLDEATRVLIDERLAVEQDHHDHVQAFDVAKAVCRFSFGLTKKDETETLVDRFMERIAAASTGGFHDEASKSAHPENFGGAFDLYGVVSLIFIRQSLQLHANIQLRDSKLPKLRALAEKYLRVIMDTVRDDGLGWCYGRGIGAYGQMHCITLLLQALRDRWVPVDKEPLARDLVRRLYANFFTTFFDAEHGLIVVRCRPLPLPVVPAREDHRRRDGRRQTCQPAAGVPLLLLRQISPQGAGPALLPGSGFGPARDPAPGVGRRPSLLRFPGLPAHAGRLRLAVQPADLPLHPRIHHRRESLHAFFLRKERAGRHGHEERHLSLPLRAA
jgi:hypothetical protein